MRIITRPIERWPGVIRDEGEREVARFATSYSVTRDLLIREVEMLGADEMIVQLGITERDIRIDGEMRADAKPKHPGVIVTFESRHGPLSYATDLFRGASARVGGSWRHVPGWHNNLRAIALGLEALRKVDRYGIGAEGEQYVGWKALGSGEGSATSKETAALLLLEEADNGEPEGVARVIEDGEFRAKVYRKAAMRTHPDHNGPESQPRFEAVQLALEVLSR